MGTEIYAIFLYLVQSILVVIVSVMVAIIIATGIFNILLRILYKLFPGFKTRWQKFWEGSN